MWTEGPASHKSGFLQGIDSGKLKMSVPDAIGEANEVIASHDMNRTHPMGILKEYCLTCQKHRGTGGLYSYSINAQAVIQSNRKN